MSENDREPKNIFETLKLVPRTVPLPAINQNVDDTAFSESFSESEFGTGAELSAIRRLTAALSEESINSKINRDIESTKEAWNPSSNTGRFSEVPIVPALVIPIGTSNLKPPVVMDAEIDLNVLNEAKKDFKTYLRALNVKYRWSAVYLIVDYLFGNASGINIHKREELMAEYQDNGFNETFVTFEAFDDFIFQIAHWQVLINENQLLRPDVQNEFHEIFKEFIIKR
jgi:hypothetical protein